MNIYFEFDVVVAAGVGQTSFWTENNVEPVGRTQISSANITSVCIKTPSAGTPTITWSVLTENLFPVTGQNAVVAPLVVADKSPIFRNSIFKMESVSENGTYSVRIDATAL